MINLEALQVFSIDDGAGGLVVASWVQVYNLDGVPKEPHTIIISNEEARLLAKELNAAVTPDESAFSLDFSGIKSSAHTAELHMHGLTYYRGAHCSGHQSQHQQVAVSNV